MYPVPKAMMQDRVTEAALSIGCSSKCDPISPTKGRTLFDMLKLAIRIEKSVGEKSNMEC